MLGNRLRGLSEAGSNGSQRSSGSSHGVVCREVQTGSCTLTDTISKTLPVELQKCTNSTNISCSSDDDSYLTDFRYKCVYPGIMNDERLARVIIYIYI